MRRFLEDLVQMRETARLELRRMDEIMRLVDHLSALSDPDDQDETTGGEGERGPLN